MGRHTLFKAVPAAVIKRVRVDQDVFLEVFALADLSLQDETLWEQLISLKLDEGACLGLACEQIDSQLETLVFPELPGTAKFSAQAKSDQLPLRSLTRIRLK